ncbi:hypothetical protein PIB30_042126 [Stylosanthes scabra]|uniref:Uncharacterized protein n=1 Tax=Stylosanthes scabra TaxID=79078 RepID=A0ABU6WFG3_9FABA|nr:hypothetical protein [Stylosanthes scabra]
MHPAATFRRCPEKHVAAPQAHNVQSSFTAPTNPSSCVQSLAVAFHGCNSSRAAIEEKKFPPDATVTPLRKSSIDFSTLDEKLGECVAEGILMMICDAVAQEMHGVTTILSEILNVVSPSSKSESRDSKLSNTAPPADLSDVPMVNKRSSGCKGTKRGRTSQVKRELNYEEKLPPGRPWLYYSAYDPNMDGEDMPHCLDLAFPPTKGMKFFGFDLAFAAYIFGNTLKLEEELVTNAHCDGTRKTLRTIMPGKPISGDSLS